ncbi:NADPH-dependent F420 reductase [Lunatimonas salinarum]|uniref:NADPH-dependent F420 reductase n=1 Tax=Lunatimonas salinarum TaxID=1774590 RepID=UPI001ADF334E|nr:NAD(P)-binding domain-containing protein [Lunatimonas salinarum]
MKLAILGGTNLATALGNKFLARGMDVVFGVREGFHAGQVAWKILQMQNQSMLTFREAIDKADIVFICSDNDVLPQICAAMNATDTVGKILVDCTNGTSENELGGNTGFILEQTNHPSLFKAFNNLGLEYPKSDPLGLVKETYFCGDGVESRLILKRLIELIGFKAIDAGKLKNAKLLDAVYHLRKEIAHVKNGYGDFHFKLMSV